VGRFLLERIPDASAGSDEAAKRSPWWALTLTLDVVAGVALMAFVALFVAANPELYARGVVRLLPQSRRWCWASWRGSSTSFPTSDRSSRSCRPSCLR